MSLLRVLLRRDRGLHGGSYGVFPAISLNSDARGIPYRLWASGARFAIASRRGTASAKFLLTKCWSKTSASAHRIRTTDRRAGSALRVCTPARHRRHAAVDATEHYVRYWPIADITTCTAHVCFRE